MKDFDYGGDWAEVEGEGEICLLAWGSSSGAVFEAAHRLREQGMPVRVIAIRLLAPLQGKALRRLIGTAGRIIVVEQNHQAQFFHYLHAQQVLPSFAESFARPGPLPFRPGEIVNRVWLGSNR